MSERFPIGAYFYPLTTQSPERTRRAAELNYKPVNETELIQQARPMYEGHKQPNVYCLGDLSSASWMM